MKKMLANQLASNVRPGIRPGRKQKGVALITAILIVAIAAIAATEMAVRQQIDMRRAANMLDGDKAQL